MTRVAATDVLVVVDPTTPGAALAHLPAGVLLADETGRRCVVDGGRLLGRLDEPSQTAACDALTAVLRRSAEAPLALVDAATVTVPTVLGDVVAEPDGLGRVLVGQDGACLALRVPAGARAALADAVDRAATAWAPQRLLDAVRAVAVDLGVAGRELGAGDFPMTLALTPAEAGAALARADGVDEAALRLRRASRSDDGFLSTFLVRPLSRRLTRRAAARGLAPAQVTALALVVGLLAAAADAVGGRWWVLLGSLLLLASLVVDCVDGEVARLTRTTSPRGGWLDVGADRVKEYAVYGGLALGAAGVGAGDARTLWLLALASLGLLVTRHFVDFGFAARRGAGASEGAVSEGVVGQWSARTDTRAAVRYAKRAVIAPVGERTIVLAVLAPVVGVRWTFVVLLVMGVVAAAWTTAGRLGRTLGARRALGAEARRRLEVQVDGAPVPPARWPLDGRWGWTLPALARALEQGGATALVAWLAPGALGGLFAWLAVVAIAEYDLVYRGRLSGDTEGGGPLALLGWPVRLTAVLAVAALAPVAAGRVLALAAVVLAVAVLVSNQRYWSRWVPSTP